MPYQTLFPIANVGSKLLEYDFLIDRDACGISVMVASDPSKVVVPVRVRHLAPMRKDSAL